MGAINQQIYETKMVSFCNNRKKKSCNKKKQLLQQTGCGEKLKLMEVAAGWQRQNYHRAGGNQRRHGMKGDFSNIEIRGREGGEE